MIFKGHRLKETEGFEDMESEIIGGMVSLKKSKGGMKTTMIQSFPGNNIFHL